ncbi:MAG: hypothetical protein IKL48_03985 [Elusimicrobiaceae bacterium]|nr:hypothetical protein [Elusimicrobiaceae bacterium]
MAKQLKDESLEYIQEQFEGKNGVLQAFGEQVDPYTFYEDLFGDLELEVPVVIIDEDETGKKIQSMTVESAIDFGRCRNDVLLGSCTYFNNWISKKSAKELYGFIIDFDNAYSGVVQNALMNDWKGPNGEDFAKPTYIVNSGTGLHLYFVLDEPLSVYHSILENVDQVYRALAIQQSRRNYIKREVQWFGQDFRMAGALNKYDWENSVFRIGDKWNINDLAKNLEIDCSFERGANIKLHQKKRKRRIARNGWSTNRAFYDCALRNCREKTKEGNRYMSMCALSVIAFKCSKYNHKNLNPVTREELERDLLSLLPGYNKDANRMIKEKEIYSAMKMFNNRAMLTPKARLEDWQGWKYTPIKRNGRKRADHIVVMNTMKSLKKQLGEDVKDGRPSAKEKVQQFRAEHTEATKAECIRVTGLSKPTVYKWWNYEN